MEQKIAPKIAPRVAPKVVPKNVPKVVPNIIKIVQVPQIVHGPQIIQIIQAPPVQAQMQIVQVGLGENFKNNQTINAKHFKTEFDPRGTKISVMEEGGDPRTRTS